MAKKHVVIAAVAGGVALTIAGGVAVAVALHKNDVVLSVDGETHSVSVREDTVKQVLEKDGITVGEHDVVAPSLDTKITNGMEISVLYGRQLQLTIDGEARTVWTTSRTVDDALTQLNLNDPDDALPAAKVTPDEDDVVTPAADTSLTDGLAISYTNVEKRATTKEEAVPFEKKEEKSDELEEGKTKVTTEGVNGVKTQNFVEVYHNGTLVSSELQNEQVTKEPVAQVTKVGTKKASKPSEGGSGSGDGSDLGPAKGSSCQASYYWQGQTTASGERFNPSDLTAAHKTLPLGSKVKVTNPSNGKTVVVRINDRGPYVAGRCLDLSKAARKPSAAPPPG